MEISMTGSGQTVFSTVQETSREPMGSTSTPSGSKPIGTRTCATFKTVMQDGMLCTNLATTKGNTVADDNSNLRVAESCYEEVVDSAEDDDVG